MAYLAEDSTDPAQSLDRPAQLVSVHARVALGRVEVLVPEQLLDLAQVRARVQELCGEDVSERVRGDVLTLVDAARLDVVPEGLRELGDVESPALDADEDGLLGER